MQQDRLSDLTRLAREAHDVRDLMRWFGCKALARGRTADAAEMFLARWPQSPHAAILRKAAVPPGTTTDPTWAEPLIPSPSVAPILALVQTDSLLGRIVGLRKLPFNASVPAQTTTGTFAWTGQGIPKAVARLDFATLRLRIGKIHGIIVVSDELLRLAVPNAESALREALISGLVRFQDEQLLDPTVAEITGVNPASLTNGVTPVMATGTVAGDVAAVLDAFYAARPGAARPTLVMSPSVAGRLAASSVQPALTVLGGLAFGVPVVTSTGAGALVVALDAAAVSYADDGLTLDVSTEATVEMNDAPAAPTSATVYASLWQLNQAGFKVERFLWWRSVPGSVQYVTTAATRAPGATARKGAA
jgi:hypothetical protein